MYDMNFSDENSKEHCRALSKFFFGIVFCTSILVFQQGEEVLRLQRKWSH